jgi:signal transduction histidine kinase
MESDDKEAFQKLRGNTDKSLQDERGKTDHYLAQKNKTLSTKAEDTIRKSRLAADEERESVRAEVDADSNSVDQDLADERKRSDSAQKLAREKEDRIRAKERFEKRLLAEALLEDERKETDHNLLDERAGLDLDSEQKLRLLSAEKSSHDLTKTALVSRDQFLAVVSHDLRNPLSSIAMSASLLRSHLSCSGEDLATPLKYVEIIERNAANMDRMISDLLDVERIANSKLELTIEKGDVCSLLQECVELFAPVVARKEFFMMLDVCSGPLIALMDHDRVLQVLSNLIGNALKFTPTGGTIKLSARKKMNEIEVAVSDNGPGIPENKKLQIFDRFSQLGSNDRRGLGLGLFISKWIVEAHKGQIWVASESGNGSTFTFTLPMAESH